MYFKSGLSGGDSIEDYAMLPLIAPETTIILAHMGGSFHFEDILQIATNPNIYVDRSYSLITTTKKIDLELFAEYIQALGSEKFIFGSDQILDLTPEEYAAKKQIGIIRKLPISNQDKENILHKNAIRILSQQNQ